jgi:hypothetical protein
MIMATAAVVVAMRTQTAAAFCGTKETAMTLYLTTMLIPPLCPSTGRGSLTRLSRKGSVRESSIKKE